MSTAAPSSAFVPKYGRVLRQLVRTRGVEVSALQASPLLGAHLGGLAFTADEAGTWLLLLLGSFALTAHVFAFNDWADAETDREEIGRVSVVLLGVAGVTLAALGIPALLCGAGIAALSVVYSFSRLGKSTPVAASLNHLVGGALHFLLGYTVAHTMDASGIALSLVFGLVFAAGHLNQEVRDHESDLVNGFRTSAVAFGCRRAFLASFCIFTAAYALIAGLALLGVLPELLLLSVIAWLLQARWSLQALRLGLGSETALWIQRRYRLLFALVGVAMLIG